MQAPSAVLKQEFLSSWHLIPKRRAQCCSLLEEHVGSVGVPPHTPDGPRLPEPRSTCGQRPPPLSQSLPGGIGVQGWKSRDGKQERKKEDNGNNEERWEKDGGDSPRIEVPWSPGDKMVANPWPSRDRLYLSGHLMTTAQALPDSARGVPSTGPRHPHSGWSIGPREDETENGRGGGEARGGGSLGPTFLRAEGGACPCRGRQRRGQREGGLSGTGARCTRGRRPLLRPRCTWGLGPKRSASAGEGHQRQAGPPNLCLLSLRLLAS